MAVKRKANSKPVTSRLLSMAEKLTPKPKCWFDKIPASLAQEIQEAVALIAEGKTTTDCASLCRAVIEDLKTKKAAGQYSGSIPSVSSAWSTMRRMVLDLQGKQA